MKLRTQVLVFLLIFALTPLLTAVVINVPLVFDNLELFYRKAHLQSLRAIFYDLDQHLANRQELVRLLSKSLPKPNLILGETGNPKDIDLARTQYTKWINLILPDHLDIVQIIFMDNTGQERFWLERDNSTEWRPTLKPPERSPEDFIRAAERLEPGQVLRSFIRLTPQNTNKDPNRFMTLYLIGRIVITIKNRSMASIGLVSMVLDVGGIAKFYPQAIWVNSNGSYLQTDTTKSTAEQAFHDYPGLDKIFAKGKLDLWKGPKGQQILWEALFPTESSGPLWVGRHVDSAPITAFRNALAIRVL
ncbi:histidine kinase, partial [Achromatium sp. WMS3]